MSTRALRCLTTGVVGLLLLAELGRIHQLPRSHSIPAGAAPEPPAITAHR